MIALPGLKSNRFIRFVDNAITNVFTTISIISFDIDTDIIKPTNPPNKALNPPVVSVPLNKLLKCPFLLCYNFYSSRAVSSLLKRPSPSRIG